MDAELALHDALSVTTTQGTHVAVGFGRPGQDALLKRLLLFDGKSGWGTGRASGQDRGDPLIAININPALDKPAAATGQLLYFTCRVAGNRQKHRPIAIALHG